MTAAFRFLHASDLHLERPPRGLIEIPEHLRAAIAEAPYRAAERVFDTALKQRVDFVVLAGDVIDPLLAGPRGLAFAGEQFQKLHDAGVAIYWAGGKVDGFERWAESWQLPASVHRFASHRVERLIHQRQGEPLCQILGTSTGQRKRIRTGDFHPDGSPLFSLAVAYGTCDVEEIAGHSINFWALGGERTRRSLMQGPITGHYCGSPQGRKPSDSGPHGCTLVQVDDQQRIRTTLIPTDTVRFTDERVAVEATTSIDDLTLLLGERLSELQNDPFGPEQFVRFHVSGSKPLSAQLRSGKTGTDLVARLRTEYGMKRPAAWTLEIEAPSDDIVPAASYDEETVLGEYLRTLKHYVDHPDDPLNLEPYLAERHLAGNLSELATLDEPALRRHVLEQAAALGAELLSPRGTRS